jgi:hypothetical protein
MEGAREREGTEMSRIRRGWELTKKSWAVLRANPDLFRFPIYGGVATIPVAILTLGPGFYFIEEDSLGAAIPIVAVGLFVLAFIGIFFSVGLAAAADKIFRGEQATVSDGLAVARANVGPIAGWALLSTIVGTLFNLLESQGTVGQIVGRLLDIGWALITFLAVPVIAIEGTGPIETLKRSASLFRSRWGQQVTGNLAIGGAVVLFGMLPAVLLIVAGVLLWSSTGFGGAILVIVGVILLLIAILVQKAMTGIFGVALYHYAAEGNAIGGFTAAELDSVVKQRKGATGPGPAPTTV